MVDYKIVSGGQTGADQGGLEGARDAGCKTGGWAPYKFLTEKGQMPEVLKGFGLQDSFKGYKDRTRMNVRDSDVTLWFGNVQSAGGMATSRACNQEQKPMILIKTQIPADILAMVVAHNWHTINIAGNRESSKPGLQAETRAFVRDLCKLLLEASS